MAATVASIEMHFHCRYCMPREVFGEGYEYLPRRAILRFEEIHRVVRVAAELGVRTRERCANLVMEAG